METADLRAFLLVVEHRSFQHAATVSRATRSALRRQVARLEKELGASLLLRGPQGIEPTTAGHLVIERAASLLRGAQTLADEVRRTSERAGGVLRLVVPLGLLTEPRAHALIELRRANPELDVVVIESEDPLAHTGEPFDVMFHFGEPPSRDAMFSQVVMRMPTGLRASTAYLDQHGCPESCEQLAAHALMSWVPPGLASAGLPLVGGGALTMRPWLRTSNLSLLVELARRGMGIVYGPWLPAIMPAEPSEGQALVPVLEDSVSGVVPLRALSPRPGRADPKIRALLENTRTLLMPPGSPRRRSSAKRAP